MDKKLTSKLLKHFNEKEYRRMSLTKKKYIYPLLAKFVTTGLENDFGGHWMILIFLRHSKSGHFYLH